MNNNNNAEIIKSKLWEMANKLRGTMDASEYKNYILPFMFYRYLSFNQNDYLIKNDLSEYNTITDENEKDEYLEDISKGIGYVIDNEYTWEKIVEKIEKHQIKASDYQTMFDLFKDNIKRNKDSEEDFSSVFSDVNLGDTRLGNSTNERAKALNDIVLMINDFDFKGSDGKDLLGDVYEYLIGQFAASAGKKGGEFYTPHQVSKILAKVVTLNAVNTGEQFKVYDPTMGSGSLLLTVQSELGFGDTKGSVDFYGQELNTTTYNLARMNLMMHGVEYRNMQLRQGDTLESDWPFSEKDGIQIPITFDAVVANPPYSQDWDTKSVDREKDVRFKGYGVAPSSKADYAFVLHGLYHLDKKGTMAVVLPHGVLFRGSSEGKIRKNLIENNLLDTIIGLPSKLFYGTDIPTCILVFKGKEARQTKDVLIIDASKDFTKSKNKNTLDKEHIDKIIETIKDRKSVEKYSKVVNYDEIVNNEYNLNIPRYVDSSEDEVEIILTDVTKDLNETNISIESSTSNLVSLLNDLTSDSETETEIKELIKALNI